MFGNPENCGQTDREASYNKGMDTKSSDNDSISTPILHTCITAQVTVTTLGILTGLVWFQEGESGSSSTKCQRPQATVCDNHSPCTEQWGAYWVISCKRVITSQSLYLALQNNNSKLSERSRRRRRRRRRGRPAPGHQTRLLVKVEV